MSMESEGDFSYIEEKGFILSNNNQHIRFDPNKPLAVGGQAVIEGVMMRAPGRIATAVRRSNGDIVVKQQPYVSLAEKNKLLKLPILRGAAGLIEMLFIGIETLNFSAEVAMHDVEAEKNAKGNGTPLDSRKNGSRTQMKPSNLRLALTVLFSLAAGIGIFFVTPIVVTTKLFSVEQDAFWFNLIAGGIRIAILLAYLSIIAMMKEVKRLFEFHGAEHKAVFTFESQADLTTDSAMRFTRFHPRCGTSFVLIVMVTAMLIFSILDSLIILWLGKISLPIRLVWHLAFIPIVGGIAYEFIRWSAKRSTTAVGQVLVAPGLWLQRITTQEPNASQLEVALVALRCALGIEETTPVLAQGAPAGRPVTYVQHSSELARPSLSDTHEFVPL